MKTSLIQEQDSFTNAGAAIFEDIDAFSADGVLTQSGLLLFSDELEVASVGTVAYSATDQIYDTDEFIALGFVNAAPNVIGNATFEDIDDFFAEPIARSSATALFDEIDEFFAEGTLIQTEEATLSFVVDIIGSESALRTARRTVWMPRLWCDYAEIRIEKATLKDDEQQAGKELEVTLTNINDRALFTPVARVDFGYGKRVSGAWDEATMQWEITDGRVSARHGSASGSPHTPSDTVTISSLDSLRNKLLKTATRPLIIYDDLRSTVDLATMDVLLDTEGRAYPTEVKVISNMTLYSLFDEIFIIRCGFAHYYTNLPDYPLMRYNCEMGHSLYDSLKAFIGMFEPAVLAVGSDVWIIDTTLASPSGFPVPREVTFDQMISIGNEDTSQHLDGLLVQYVAIDNAYDYTTFRFTDGIEHSGNTRTEFHRIFIEFRKREHPYVVLREALNIEEKSIYSNDVLIEQSSENWIYGPGGNVASRRKTVSKLLPNLADPNFGLILQPEREENEDYEYAAHPFKIGEQYIARRTMHVTGLVATDSVNKQLGHPYAEAMHLVYRSGNLLSTTTVQDASISSYEESSEPLRNGNVKTRVQETDEIVGIVTKDYTEERPGDIGIRAAGPSQKQVLLFAADNVDHITQRIDPFHVGELPLALALPLARRTLIKRMTKSVTLNARLAGYDPTILRGVLIEAKAARHDTVPVKALVVGRNIDSDKNGTFMSVSLKQV